MSLTLRQIYESTKTTYHLTLTAGAEGIDNIMNWVYVTEDITTNDFLKGGELIVTTGMHCQSEDDLYHFILTMIQAGTCGAILNIGRYIQSSYISDRIFQLCKDSHYPLITMPWNVHIYDITRDYYNRIFLEQQTNDCITDAFLSYIRRDSNLTSATNVLEDHGYNKKSNYLVSILHCYDQLVSEDLKQRLFFQILSNLKSIPIKFHVSFFKNHFLFIAHTKDTEKIRIAMNEILTRLQTYHKKLHLHVGLGTLVDNLSSLHISYERAVAALTLAQKQETPIYSFEEMGFFQLLHSTHDKKLLESYRKKYLGEIESYDVEHHTNYLETLRQFIQYNGSIQLVASQMFCHRNTVSYRMNVIKETWNIDLADMETKFHFMTAFYIQDYLTLLS